MQREIKFKAWHSGLKRMFSAEEMAGDQMTLLPTGQFINVHSANTRLSVIFSHKEMLPLEYTGLKDKNGVEIYEGDIVKAQGEERQVVWKDFGWCTASLKTNSYYSLCENEKYTVIGNIHENPELLN